VADQAVAQITAEPMVADVNTINGANSHINAAFHAGKTPTYFGIGKLGGAYSTTGTGSETEANSVHMTVDLTKMASLHNPPSTADAAAHHNMVAAISSFGAGDGDSSGNFKSDKYDDHLNVWPSVVHGLRRL
jgi:hypothetical protein